MTNDQYSNNQLFILDIDMKNLIHFILMMILTGCTSTRSINDDYLKDHSMSIKMNTLRPLSTIELLRNLPRKNSDPIFKDTQKIKPESIGRLLGVRYSLKF